MSQTFNDCNNAFTIKLILLKNILFCEENYLRKGDVPRLRLPLTKKKNMNFFYIEQYDLCSLRYGQNRLRRIEKRRMKDRGNREDGKGKKE
jgi:hypothetical protein